MQDRHLPLRNARYSTRQKWFLTAEVFSLQLEKVRCMHDLARRYSEDQPRVPAGNPDGGQFASSETDGGSNAEATDAGFSGERSIAGWYEDFMRRTLNPSGPDCEAVLKMCRRSCTEQYEAGMFRGPDKCEYVREFA